MMAIPAIIVVLVMASTVLRLGADTLVSSLATISVPVTYDLDSPMPTMESKSSIESGLILGEESGVPREDSLILGEPKLRESDLILNHEVTSGPRLSAGEMKAKEKLVAHIGGEEKLRSIEQSMSAAFSAAARSLSNQGISIGELDVIGVIDFTMPSYARRLAIFHPKTGQETRHLVSHGANTGKLYATSFSNRSGSHQSSLGLYQIGKRYRGSHGASLRLHGLEETNDKAFRRAVVMHSAWYVSYKAIVKNLNKEGVPRLGRSHGCPAVHKEELSYVLSKLQPGSYLYIYAGEK